MVASRTYTFVVFTFSWKSKNRCSKDGRPKHTDVGCSDTSPSPLVRTTTLLCAPDPRDANRRRLVPRRARRLEISGANHRADQRFVPGVDARREKRGAAAAARPRRPTTGFASLNGGACLGFGTNGAAVAARLELADDAIAPASEDVVDGAFPVASLRSVFVSPPSVSRSSAFSVVVSPPSVSRSWLFRRGAPRPTVRTRSDPTARRTAVASR